VELLERDAALEQLHALLNEAIAGEGKLESPDPEPAPQFARHMAGDWAGAAELWQGIGCPFEQACALTDGTFPLFGGR
jgi:hypothetical protein